MNNTEIVADLRALASKIEGSAPAPGPAIVPSNPFADIPAKYQHAEAGPYPGRYDDPLPEGTVGGVKMLVTGHVLSMAQPQYDRMGKQIIGQGESFVPYVRRVRYQITANADGTPNAEKAQQVINALGFLMQSSSTLKSFVAENPDTWPFAADEFINQELYHPVDPADAARSIKQWSDAQALMREQAAAAGVPVPVVPPEGPVVVEG
jgi:hypothetical protein